jgi:hypothetical protein
MGMQRAKLVKRDQAWYRISDDEEIEQDEILETLDAAPDGSQIVIMILDEEDLLNGEDDLELVDDE